MGVTTSEFILKLRYRLDDHGATQIFDDPQLEDILLECTRVEGYDSFSDIDDKFLNLILKHATAECWYALSKHYAEAYSTAQGSKQKFNKMVGGGALSVSFEESDLEELKENAVIAYNNGRNAFEAYLELKRNLLTERQPEASMSTSSQVVPNNISVNEFGEDRSEWADDSRVKVKF